MQKISKNNLKNLEEQNKMSAFELVDMQLKAMNDSGEETIIIHPNCTNYNRAIEHLNRCGLIKLTENPVTHATGDVYHLTDEGNKVLNNYKNFEKYIQKMTKKQVTCK
jgi:predicted transcriptional regulator